MSGGDKLVARLAGADDDLELRQDQSGGVYVFNATTQKLLCNHVHERDALVNWIQDGCSEGQSLCPTCAAGGKEVAAISQRSDSTSPSPDESRFDSALYDLFNSPRDDTEPQFVTPEFLYHTDSKVHVHRNMKMPAKYTDFLLYGTSPDSGRTYEFEHKSTTPKDSYNLAYTTWWPEEATADTVLPVVVLTHGVPMSQEEWFQIARILGRFARVVTVDLLGMGRSSKPTKFVPPDSKPSLDGNPKSHWSWAMQARAFHDFIQSLAEERDFKASMKHHKGKVFLCANDWGAGMVQKFASMFPHDLLGQGVFSAIALSGYWVQHIGSLQALAMLPYRDAEGNVDPVFMAETVRFAGVLTSLLETMFHRTSDHINQYSIAPYQKAFVRITYDDPSKNPGNTEYRAHPVRVLAEQAAAALGNGELLPYHPKHNPRGMHFSRWLAPLLLMWGRQDKMMPEGQRHRFGIIAEELRNTQRAQGEHPTFSFTERSFEEAGHFAIRDQPLKTAHEMLVWMRTIVGASDLFLPYMGLEGIARTDERYIMRNLGNAHHVARTKLGFEAKR